MDGRTGGRMDRQAGRQPNGRTDRHMDRHTHRQMNAMVDGRQSMHQRICPELGILAIRQFIT
eukprot:scaffold227496_cov17-Prasinocladus_malaysianus.AAC.1